ncbi:glycosyltransferase family 39 protein [Hymenobacter guriensis]|uniref:Glycosyltransferase family 39 protein n=1 Tax=Hymenobacter guriensis TaxID=2793065 RepID=A0ABS0L4T9_9BACT|nr:glycosyltransferase family 39 protein [Hymenobacter guriensis]MBG8554414.1 glycosyltransferase family 39 protein [Hymenobacter guriensis]
MPASAALNPLPAFSRRTSWLVAAGLLVWALLLHGRYLSHLPEGIHSWAQADRLALALSYYDHGMHLFRPQTFSLQSVDGVVGVEFPLLAYLAALGGKMLGREAVVPLLRLLTLLTTVLGGWYAFRMVYERSGRVLLALVPAVFWLTSPVVAFYANNFLPDSPAAALCLVGFYYYLRFVDYRRLGDLRWAALALLVGTLLKTSAGVYLIAVLGSTVLWAYLQPVYLGLYGRLWLLGLLLTSLGLIVGYTIYNQQLNALYQSDLFIAAPRPLESWHQLDAVWIRIRDLWAREYLTPLHYAVLVGTLVVLAVRRGSYRTYGAWYAQVGLGLIGALCFFGLMGQQYFDHDYYVIAPFGPVLVLLVALAALQLAHSSWPRWAPTLAGMLLLALVGWGGWRFWQRQQPVYLPFSGFYDHQWLMGGAEALRQAGVPDQATLLVMSDMQAPNTALVYFDRRGLVWKRNPLGTTLPDVEKQMADFGLSHLVLPRAAFEQWWASTPAAQASFRPIVRQPAFVVLARQPAVPHWP